MADRIIKFRGQFDASQVLTSLKQIRQQLSSAGVKDSMFTNVDKDIAAAERAMSELLAQAQKGFKNTSEVDAFAKRVEKLDLAFTKINKELEGLNLSENFSDTSKELENIKKEINEIIKKNAKLKEATEALLEPSNKTVFATQEYKKAIQEAIDKQEDLAKALEEVNKKQAESGYNTLKNQFNKLDAEGKATATASILNNQDLSFGKNVSTEFIEKYKKALNEIIVEGKNAKQVFDALGQELSEEDQSYATSAQFVEDYANNLNQAAKAAANAAKLNSGIVSQATTKATAIGGYSVDGTFHAANVVQPVIDYNNAMQQSIVLTQRRATEEQRIADVAEQAQRDITQGLTNQRNGQQQVIDTQRDQIQTTRDQVTAQQGLNDVFDRMSTSVKQLFSIGTALSTVRRVITETFQDVQKLDKAFGSIAMVTSYSVDEMWQSYSKYAEMAAELGQTTESVIQSSALFYQQGLDTAEALELTEQTMKLATLAGADFQTATSQMTAALRGFHMEMTQGAHVTDVYSELAANAAADVNGIAYAMSKTASIASSAGMAFETTAAFLTQMIETTQEAPENIGTAMKTIIARFTELKNNVSAAESEFEDLDYNKVDTALKSVGISLKDSMGQFRNLDEVFLELSQKWDTLDRNTQRYIATTAAGSRQQSRFLAMMENYDRTLELIETAQDSAGRSSEQFAKYQDTIESKIKKLKTSWEQLRVGMLNPNNYKGVIEAVTKIVEKLNKMDIKQIASIGVVFATVGKKLVTNLISSIQGSATKISKAISAPVEQGSRRITELVVDGLNVTTRNLKKIYPELNNELIQTLGKTNETVSADLLAKLNNLGAGAQSLALEYMEGAKALKTQDDKLTQMVRKLHEQGVSEEVIRNLMSDQTTELGQQAALYEQMEKQQEMRRRNLAQQGLTENQLDTLQQSGANITTTSDQLRSIFAGTGGEIQSALTGLLTTSISSALVSSLTTIASGGSVEDAIKNTGKTLLITALPQAISSAAGILVPKLITVFTTTVLGPVTAVIGAAIGTYLLARYIQNNGDLRAAEKIAQQAEEKFEKAKERYTIIKQMTDEDEKNLKEQNERVDNLSEEINRYKELNEIHNKTTEEQEEYNELIKNLQNELPELKDFYDERNNQLTISNAKLDEMLNKEKEIARQKTALYYADQISEIQAERNVLRAEDIANYTERDKEREQRIKDLKDEEKYRRSEYARAHDNGGKANPHLDQEIEDYWNDYYTKQLEIINNEFEEEDKKIREAYYNNLKESAEKLKKVINEAIDKEFSDYNETYRNILHRNEGDISTYEEGGKAKIENLLGDIQLNSSTDFSTLPLALRNDIEALYGSRDAAIEYFNQLKEFASDDEITSTLINDLGIKEASVMAKNAAEKFDEQVGDELREQFQKDIEEFMLLTPEEFETAVREADWGILNKEKEKIQDEYEQTRAELLKQSGIGFLTNGYKYSEKNGGTLEKTRKIFDEEELKQLTNDELTSLNNFAEDKIKELGRDTAEKYLGELSNIMGNLDIQDQVQIMNFLDWENVDASNLEEYKKKFTDFYIETINDGKDSPEVRSAAESMFDSMVEAAEDNKLYSAIVKSWNEAVEKIQKKYESVSKQGGIFKSVLAGEETLIDQSDLDSFKEMIEEMQELGFLSKDIEMDDLFTWDSEKGKYLANIKEVKKVWKSLKTDETQNLAKIALKDLEAQAEKTGKAFTGTKNALTRLSEGIDLKPEEWETIKNYSKETGTNIYENLKQTEAWDKSLNNLLDDTAEKLEKLKSSIKESASLVSTFKSAALEQVSDKKVSISTYSSIADDITKMNEQYKDLNLNVNNYIDTMGKFNWTKYESDLTSYILKLQKEGKDAGFLVQVLRELKEAHQEVIDKQKELEENARKEAEEAAKKIQEERQKLIDEAQKNKEDAEKAVEDATKDVTKAEEDLKKAQADLTNAQKAVADAYEEIAEKEKAVLEVQKELNEAMYGTGNSRKSTLDGLYNYDQLLKQINNDISDLKENFSDYSSGMDAGTSIMQYGQLMHNKKVNLMSQQVAYQSNLGAAKSVLGEYSAYYTEINGRLLVDVAKLNAAAMPDKIKDQIESTVQTYNDSVDKIHDISNQIKQIDKEFRDFQKTYRDKYINLQEKVIETLRNQAQEELNIEKEKYAAMEEADNEYVDALEAAIAKQRELRQQENDENDLAQKEKKLSLLQRDTSGANQKDILKQQQDVENTRQNLNDKKIDSIVKSLRELYKEQKKSRDAEIKYRETVLQNATFIEEANAVISSWQTADDLVSWFYEHSQETQNMTNEQLEQYTETLKQMYYDREIYMNTSMQDFTEMLNVSQEEINGMTSSVTQNLANETEQAFARVRNEVNKTIQDLEKKLQDAQQAVDDAKQKLSDALDVVATNVTKVQEATDALAEARKKLTDQTNALAAATEKLTTAQAANLDEVTNSSNNSSGGSFSGGGSDSNSENNNNHPTSTTPYYDSLSSADKARFNAAIKNIDNTSAQYWWAGADNRPDDMDKFGKALKEKYGSSVWGEGQNTGNIYYAKNSSILENKIAHGEIKDSIYTYHRFAKGGLVNYTGPAWVDGTPAQPEAFLSVEDTRNIAHFTDVLSSLYNSFGQFNPSVSSNHETVINVTINVDGVSSDYDVDQAVERVKQNIIDAAHQIGSTVILHQ